MNKNQQFQAEKERRDQLNKFARALAAGQTGLLNRTGQTLTAGDIVFYLPPEPVAYAIVDVAPCMDVRLPAGLLNVTIMALPFTVQVPAGQQWRQALPSGLKGDVVPKEVVEALEKVIASAGRRVDMVRMVSPDEQGLPEPPAPKSEADDIQGVPLLVDEGGRPLKDGGSSDEGGSAPPEGTLQ